MKKNFKNFIIVTLAVAIIGAVVVAIAEEIFGIQAVFMVSFSLVMVAGLYVLVVQSIRSSAHRKVRRGHGK